VILEGSFTNVSNEAMRHRLVELGLAKDLREVPARLF
jgi:hypothetical protein